LVLFVGLCGAAAGQPTLMQSLQVSPDAIAPGAGGPIRLRQAVPTAPAGDVAQDDGTPTSAQPPVKPYVPGEFECFVQRHAGPDTEVRLLGAELMTGAGNPRAAELSPFAPGNYVLGPGDAVLVTLWGSVESALRLTVDRNVRISISRVGTIQLGGLQYEELPATVNRRVSQVFRNFESGVSLGQLRGIRVFVTGFVVRPGTYAVSCQLTANGPLVLDGEPSAAGSLRHIEVRRGSESVVRLDLYELLLRGDGSSDGLLQAGDVVHVGAVGTEVGTIGSVSHPAVLELRAGETVADVLRMAGGFTAVSDRSRLAVERLSERTTSRMAQLELPRDAAATLGHGDLQRAFSAVDATSSVQHQAKRVRVEGGVARPGEYGLGPTSTINHAIRAADGLTPAVFVFATEFTRVSVQLTQQDNYERALRDFETNLARASSTQPVVNAEDAAAQTARSVVSVRFVERLRALRPNGRVVFQLPNDASDLPDLLLEDGARSVIPSRPSTVGVMGSVFNAPNYLDIPGRSIVDYPNVAGGPTKGADRGSVFVVCSNGSVVSSAQGDRTWFGQSVALAQVPAKPSDTVFVPEKTDKTTFLQAAKDWTQIVDQLGLGIAGLVAATR
jgi:protein involved in polysaccharide export with SLBB domain